MLLICSIFSLYYDFILYRYYGTPTASLLRLAFISNAEGDFIPFPNLWIFIPKVFGKSYAKYEESEKKQNYFDDNNCHDISILKHVV